MEPQDDIDLQDLRLLVSHALEIADADDAVAEAEVYASWCEHMTGSILHNPDRPDDIALPPRVHTDLGLSFLVVINDHEGRHIGFSIESEELSPDNIRAALQQAKLGAIPTPEFGSLPHPESGPATALTFYDPEVLALPLDDMPSLTSDALNGAISTLRQAGFVTRLDIQGRVQCRKEHAMFGNTHGLLAGETRTALLTTMLVQLTQNNSQGHGSSSAAHLSDFSPYEAGEQAANRALQAQGSIVLDAGDYPVIFGPEAMAALVQDLLIPALSLDTVATSASPFAHALAQPIASPLLTVADEGRLPRGLGSRLITDEGVPTGTTTLIANGRLTGFLADTFHAQFMLDSVLPIVPRNGMRHSLDHQSFNMRPGIFPTNVVVSSDQAVDAATLLNMMGDGIYIGGLWATSFQGNPQNGDFRSTLIGPSFRIEQGQRTHPLQPGVMQVHGNIRELVQHIAGISADPQPIALSNLQSQVLSPDVYCRRLQIVR